MAEPVRAVAPDLRGYGRSSIYPRHEDYAQSLIVQDMLGLLTALGRELRYPAALQAFRRQCRAAGQTRPTPLLLHYTTGGYNRLHRDLYGPLAFPLQATAMLSRRGSDYTGGEFLLVENVARQQSRGEAIAAEQGDLIVFPVRERPVAGKRGPLRAELRHGMSRVHSGERYALGIIFHDAE